MVSKPDNSIFKIDTRMMIATKVQSRVQHADRQHPEGPSLKALMDEIAEYIEAERKGCPESSLYELYDVAAVAFRMLEIAETKKLTSITRGRE